jgi:predicted transcriptional regulator
MNSMKVLTKAEEEIMQYFWENNQCSVSDIIATITRTQAATFIHFNDSKDIGEKRICRS